MASALQLTAGAGLISVSKFIEPNTPLTPESRGVLLSKIVGLLYTAHNRPPVMVLFAEENLPQPTEIAMFQGEDVVYADTQMPDSPGLARVAAFIRRRLADDAYVLHLHPTRSFFFVVTDAPRHPLLEAALKTKRDAFIQKEWFPVYMWNTQQSEYTPSYFEQNGPECTYYSDHWVATLRLCEDCLVRPTRWTNIALPDIPSEKGWKIVGSSTRPMLLIPQQTKTGGACVIRPLKDYQYASASAWPPVDLG